MKKKPDGDELRPEYDFSGGVRGKYARRYAEIDGIANSIPADWVAKSTRLSLTTRDLCVDALTISSHIGGLLSSQLRDISTTEISSVSSHLEGVFSRISEGALGINRLVESAGMLGRYDTVATSLIGQQSLLNPYVQIPSAIAATGAYLDTANALTSAIQVSTNQLANLDLVAYEAAMVRGMQVPNLPTAIISDSVLFGSLGRIADHMEINLSSASELLSTTLATSRITSEVISIGTAATLADYLNTTTTELSRLSSLGASVYSDLLSTQTIEPPSFLFAAPAIEPYAQIQATSVLVGVRDVDREAHSVASADARLDALGDDLEERLAEVSLDLVEAYQEGIAAIRSGNKGWIRHAGVSFRTMFEHLLLALAPNAALDEFFEDAEAQKQNGEYLRAARLAYVFRDVAVGSYARMAEHDIKLAEATFFPMNQVVHELDTPLTERQMKVLSRRIQGSVSVVLAAAGY